MGNKNGLKINVEVTWKKIFFSTFILQIAPLMLFCLSFWLSCMWFKNTFVVLMHCEFLCIYLSFCSLWNIQNIVDLDIRDCWGLNVLKHFVIYHNFSLLTNCDITKVYCTYINLDQINSYHRGWNIIKHTKLQNYMNDVQ